MPVLAVLSADPAAADPETAYDLAGDIAEEMATSWVGFLGGQYDARHSTAPHGALFPSVLLGMRQRLSSRKSVLLWGRPTADVRRAVFALAGEEVVSCRWALMLGQPLRLLPAHAGAAVRLTLDPNKRAAKAAVLLMAAHGRAASQRTRALGKAMERGVRDYVLLYTGQLQVQLPDWQHSEPERQALLAALAFAAEVRSAGVAPSDAGPAAVMLARDVSSAAAAVHLQAPPSLSAAHAAGMPERGVPSTALPVPAQAQPPLDAEPAAVTPARGVASASVAVLPQTQPDDGAASPQHRVSPASAASTSCATTEAVTLGDDAVALAVALPHRDHVSQTPPSDDDSAQPLPRQAAARLLHGPAQGGQHAVGGDGTAGVAAGQAAAPRQAALPAPPGPGHGMPHAGTGPPPAGVAAGHATQLPDYVRKIPFRHGEPETYGL